MLDSRSRSRSSHSHKQGLCRNNLEVCVVTLGGDILARVGLNSQSRVAILVREIMRGRRGCEFQLAYQARLLCPFRTVSECGLENGALVTAVQTKSCTKVAATKLAFACITAASSVITWGHARVGGDSSRVAAALSSGVVSLVSNGFAFVAIKVDGSAVAWGDDFLGATAVA